MRIFLIGYMASGKSTAGKKLASKLGMKFIDLDEYIETEYGKSIEDIFSGEGEERFRELEHRYLQKVSTQDNTVFSLGGGTPCFYNNMELINKNGTSIYFKMSADALAHRLANAKKKRPKIAGMNEEQLKTFIHNDVDKREIFYLQAHYKVKAKDLDIDELVDFLKKEIGVAAPAAM
jgi:shikimate kinase